MRWYMTGVGLGSHCNSHTTSPQASHSLLLLLHPSPAAASAVARAAAAVNVAVDRNPLTATGLGAPMVRMRVCSFMRRVVSTSSTLYCGLCTLWLRGLVLQWQYSQTQQVDQQPAVQGTKAGVQDGAMSMYW
jgi:hypothetical protein